MKLKAIKFTKRTYVLLGALFLLVVGVITFQTQERFVVSSGQHEVDYSNLSGEYNQNDLSAIFEGETITLALDSAKIDKPQTVLGDATAVDKRIEVDLTNQKLYAFEGDKKVFDFVISSGKTRTPTPPGEYRPWIKLRYTKMEGGSKARGDYYYLPNVPYVMFFENDEVPGWEGYAIHGTYWHDNFGVPMSRGCVNLKIPDAEKIYNWAKPDLEGHRNVKVTNHNPGTKIIIYGETPAS